MRIFSTHDEIKTVRGTRSLEAHTLLMLFLAPYAVQAFNLTPSPQMINGSHAASHCVPGRANFIARQRDVRSPSYILDTQDGNSLDFLSARREGSGSPSGSSVSLEASGGGGGSFGVGRTSPRSAVASSPTASAPGGFSGVTSGSFSDFIVDISCSHPAIPIVPEPNPAPGVGAVVIAAIALQILRASRPGLPFAPKRKTS